MAASSYCPSVRRLSSKFLRDSLPRRPFPIGRRTFATTTPRHKIKEDYELARAQEREKRLQDIASQENFSGEPIVAAPEIDFKEKKSDTDNKKLRIVPASPSYFTGRPHYVDAFLEVQKLIFKYQILPVVPPGEAPRAAWQPLGEFQTTTGEPMQPSKYSRLITMLKRLNQINPALIPDDVTAILNKYRRNLDPYAVARRQPIIDDDGRAYGSGNRKTSSARVWLVEGDGQILVNSKPINKTFALIHDRESALWPLRCTARLDKYNAFILVRGGGTTGQAEAITHALGKALLVHEPALKPFLRRAGVVTRDPRRVERKKPGKLKARKGQVWRRR